ncbi:RBM43 isoform 2 [Pongo abelii]|uniref:RBM43 isoform 2 n=1 Tax=Pongo abelii TaxID=9601 RepID=A0A2J8V7H9_PONAB|nr:RBM43 isoform 2 [Pongo abelii]
MVAALRAPEIHVRRCSIGPLQRLRTRLPPPAPTAQATGRRRFVEELLRRLLRLNCCPPTPRGEQKWTD